MTTSYGDAVSFKNCLIVMTSNLGSSSQSIGFLDNDKNLVMDKIKDFLGVELLNRIDSVCFFHEFSEKTIDRIICSKVKQLYPNISKDRLQKIIKEVKERCQYQQFGARKVDKVLEQLSIEYSLLT